MWIFILLPLSHAKTKAEMITPDATAMAISVNTVTPETNTNTNA
jgi:hypothetical protein